MSDARSGRTRVGVDIGGAFTDLVARGGELPVRVNSSLVQRGAETTTAAPTTPSAEDVDASFGPSAVPQSS